MTDFNLDTSSYELDTQGLPLGKYRAMIKGAEIRASENAANPQYVSVGFEILTGKNKGVIKQHIYSVWHENPIVKNIARDGIKKLAIATGKEIRFSGENDVNQAFQSRVVVLEVTPAKKEGFTNIAYFNAEDKVDEETPTTSDAPF